jgi:hypothetical protein
VARRTGGRCQQAAEIIRASLAIDVGAWIAKRREDAAEYRYSSDEALLGEWPIKAVDQGSITPHKDIRSGKIKPKVYLGLAKIE